MLEEASPSWEPPRRAAAALPPAGTRPGGSSTVSTDVSAALVKAWGKARGNAEHRGRSSTGPALSRTHGPSLPLCSTPGCVPAPISARRKVLAPHPRLCTGIPSTRRPNLSSQLPQAAPSPLLPATRTPNSHPSAPSSPSIPSSDSAVTTRPPHAPSLPTTQLPLQQETAPVNHCSSPLICLPGCEERRTRGCESPPALCPRGSSSFIGPGQGRGSCRAAGEMAGPQPLWGHFSHMTAP